MICAQLQREDLWMPRPGATVNVMTYSFVALAGAQPAFEDSWERAEVRRLLRDVLDELQAAHTVLRALSEETAWTVRDTSIRALHQSLTEHSTHTRGATERIHIVSGEYLS